jgi:hypothetical protein
LCVGASAGLKDFCTLGESDDVPLGGRAPVLIVQI